MIMRSLQKSYHYKLTTKNEGKHADEKVDDICLFSDKEDCRQGLQP